MRSLLHTHPGQPLQAHEPAVFVVTTVFQDFSFLVPTLASVIEQQPPGRPVVHLIKDASPTDAGLELIEQALKRLSPPAEAQLQLFYWHQPDSGLYAGLAGAFAHILAINHHPQTLLTYLNADDLLQPRALERVCRLQAATRAEWLLGAPHMIDSRGRTLLRCPRGVPYSQARIRQGLYLGDGQPFIQQEGSFWSLGLFRQCRGFDPGLQLAGDFDLWLQLAARRAPLCLPVATGAFRRRPGQKSEDMAAYRQEASAVLAAAASLASASPACEQAFMAMDVDGQPAVAAIDPAGAAPAELADPLLAEPLPSAALTGMPLAASRIRVRQQRRDWLHRQPPAPELELARGGWCRGQPQQPARVRLRASQPGLQVLRLELLAASRSPEIQLELRSGQRLRTYTLSNGSSHESWPHPARQLWHRRLQLVEPLNPELELELEIRCEGASWFALRVDGQATRVAIEPSGSAHPGWPYLADPAPLPPATDNAVPIAVMLDATAGLHESRAALALQLQHSLAALRQQHYGALQVGLLGAASLPGLAPVLQSFGKDLGLLVLPAQEPAAALAALLRRHAHSELVGWLKAGDRLAPGALRRVAQAHRQQPADLIGGYRATNAGRGRRVQHEQPVPLLGPAAQAGWFWRRGWLEQLLADPEGPTAATLWQHASGLRLGATLVHAQPAPAVSVAAPAPPRLLWINDVGPCGGAGLAHHHLIRAVQQHGSPVLALHAARHWRPDGHPVGHWRRLARQIEAFAPDAIVAGNLHGLRCDHLALLRQLAAEAPCLWVSHDFWLSNGRDPYPSLDARQPLPPADATTQRWQEQLGAIANLHLIANSQFCHHALSATALAPLLLDAVLPLGFERSFSRLNQQLVGVSSRDPAPLQLLVGSVGLDDPRKGASLLVGALEQLPASSRAQIVVRSYGHTPVHDLHGLCAYHHLGYLDGPGIRAACAQADLYINPSLIETFGQVSVEALLAGAWLVSVRNGGVADFARDGVNATLVDANAQALSRGLQQAIEQLQALHAQGPAAIEHHRNRQALSVDHYSLENSGLQLLRALAHQGLGAPAALGFNQPVRPEPPGPVPTARLR